MAEKWDGQGKPPSRQAAVEWVMDQTGLPRWAVEGGIVPKSGTLTHAGDVARGVVEQHEKDRAENEGKSWWERNVTDRLPALDNPLMDPLNLGGRRRGPADHSRQREVEASEGKATTDQITEALESDDPAAGLEALGVDVGGIPGLGGGKGNPIWPYEGDTTGLEVADRSIEGRIKDTLADTYARTDPDTLALLGVSPEMVAAHKRGRTGARYFDRDSLGPLKWSPEQRAALQRDLHAIGLYGDEKVRLGSWSALDQQVFTEVLGNANVEGLTWRELVKQWRRNPPQDILDRIRTATKGPRPVVEVTDPRDILRTSSAVSQDLIGRVDRSFVDSTVPGVQAAEAGAQNAAYDAPAGATVTQAPSPAAFAEHLLRSEKPVEVDGYQFLTQFQTFMQMLGVG